MKDRRLLEARTALTECAQVTCPGLVVRDCTRWLDEVQKAMPSIVLDVRDAAGQTPAGARVEIDGRDVPEALTGKAFENDPGEHSVRVTRAGAAPFDSRIVVREGEREQVVPIRLPGPTSTTTPPREVLRRAPVPTSVYVLGALGGVALGVFGVAAIKGIVDRHDLGCDVGCASGPRGQVETEFDVADVALPVGVASLAIAAWIYFSRGYEPRAAFLVEPLDRGAMASWLAPF
jgi:hypothetical protein